MRWRRSRRSANIEDRRGNSGGGSSFPGAGGKGRGFRFPGSGRGGGRMRRGGLSGVGLIIVVGLFLLFGGDIGGLLQQAPVSPQSGRPSGTEQFPDLPDLKNGQRDRSSDRSPNTRQSNSSDEPLDFVSAVLADTEDTWKALFKQFGQDYREPKLVVFSGSVRSACGFAQSAMGPFYCPGDQKIYLDMSFFRDLRDRFRAPGDFAQAYVIAHEIGHHVQTILGVSARVRQAQSGAGQSQSNAIQVRMELQADCFAGVWAHHADRTRDILEDGDVEEALGAANAIGDDRLQRQSQGRVVPDSFTHGTSEQRERWFTTGLETGNLRACDTFRTDRL